MTPTLGDREAEELGFEAADAAEREGGGVGEEKGTWHSGEVGKWALPRPQREDRTEGMREGTPHSGKARPQPPPRTQLNGTHLHKAKTGLNA